MLKFNVVRNHTGVIDHIETALKSCDLLGNPKLNKGCAFNAEERTLFQLNGLLPHYIETLEQQVARMYAQYSEHTTPIAKNIYLNVLLDYNETLFYKLVSEHLEEMLPIIYTPTVGKAVERFSIELRKPRGLYISYAERNNIQQILTSNLANEIDLIVVTDGEAVLGLGDQGVGGIKICNAKLMVYTLCAGIDPNRVLSIQLDVGTNNPQLLADPMYLGWRHERITGQKYDDFVDAFVTAIKKKLPNVYLHWEDIGRDNARRILTRYKNKICTINGDMQSTGVVTLACILAGCTASHLKLTEHRIIILGAGTAGVGIAEQIVAAMQRMGISAKEAYSRLWLIDRQGLLLDNQESLLPFQQPFAHSITELKNWAVQENQIGLQEVVDHVKPTILVGCSAQANAFSESIIKAMAKHTDHPIILPLSNPTQKSEAQPDQLLTWTKGKAIIATGSPFSEVKFSGRKIRIAQSNNAYSFPGIALGAIAVKAKKLTDNMLWAATEALSNHSPVHQDKTAPLLPKLSESLSVSHQIALAVAKEACKEGLTQVDEKADLNELIRSISWEPKYYSYKKN